MISKTLGAALTASVLLAGLPAHAATEITWWHAMGGKLGDKVNQIADDFNKSQSEYKVVPVFKGTYPETMTAAIAAFRAHQAPDIVQVFEVGTATMMGAKGAIYPVYKLMKDANEPFDPSRYLPAVTGYYTDSQGNMLSLPFNSSTPIVYYNKDAFKKAGLDPNKPPKTWPEMEKVGKALLASGEKCGFTTSWPSWIQVENFSAWHNLPIGTKSNGFDGLDAKLTINSPAHVQHIAQMAEWQKTKIFDYGGRADEAAPKFYSGECAMYMASSASRAGVLANSKFDVGMGMLPYAPSIAKKPQNSIIGGASLWVLSGHKEAEYKGVAKFFSYLSSPKVQADWHQFTGYLPITKAAYELSKEQGYYKKNPGADIAIKQINLNPPTANSKGLRFGNYVQIRDIINQDLEAAFSGKETAKAAMDDAVERGDALLRQFEDDHKAMN